MAILDDLKVKSIKELSVPELNKLCGEIREKIINTTKETGGHLASSLGCVEIIVALNYVFNFDKDKVIYDVGHQSYAHKILTDRNDAFDTLRKLNGISGFPKREESPYDFFDTGHSSTAISAGLGMCRARDLANENHNVIAVVGDGALTGGMSFEALNDIGSRKTKMLIVLNDNDMSISKNVGGMSKYLSKVRANKVARNIKTGIRKFFSKIPLLGKLLIKICDGIKNFIFRIFFKRNIFEDLGVKYFGAINGHNVKQLIKYFEGSKTINAPMIIHVKTKKGKGMKEAEENPEIYHGIAPKNCIKKGRSFGENLGKTLAELAEKDEKIIAVTAAMAYGTGIDTFLDKFPERTFDVGIAEEHAVTMCAGLAVSGFKPYFMVYSTFFQRGFDQLFHDVILQKLPVKFCVDRAGLVGRDGETHHGILDLSYYYLMPNLTIFAPKDNQELTEFLKFSVDYNFPLVIRYGKYDVCDFHQHTEIEWNKWECVEDNNSDVVILTFGYDMLKNSIIANANVKKKADIYNCRFLKPMDESVLLNIKDKKIITLEDNYKSGGFGEAVLSFYRNRAIDVNIKMIGIEERIVSQGANEELYDLLHIGVDDICKAIEELS